MIYITRIRKLVKKLIRHFWFNRYQFLRYFMVGTSGFVIDLGALIIFKRYFGLDPIVSVVFSQIVAMIYVFILNKIWSFKERSMPHKQFVRYAILTAFNYLFGIAMMYVFQRKFGFDYKLVRLVSVMLATSWNFLLYKHWVYT